MFKLLNLPKQVTHNICIQNLPFFSLFFFCTDPPFPAGLDAKTRLSHDLIIGTYTVYTGPYSFYILILGKVMNK